MSRLPHWGGGRILLSQVTAITSGGSVSPSNVFSNQTYQVRVSSTLAGWLSIGDGAQTATANSGVYLPANIVDYYTVAPGQSIAFISTSTSSGYFTASEMI